MSAERLEALRADHWVGQNHEYSEEEAQLLLWQKYQSRAAAIERKLVKELSQETPAKEIDCFLCGDDETSGHIKKDEEMAIKVLEEVESTGPVSKEVGALIDMAEIKSQVAMEVAVKVGEASQKAIDRMDRMVTDVMRRVKEELGGLSQQKTRIMAVEVNGIRHKLSQAANPNLGRMLVNAKLGENTLLVGPAGSGKTTAAHQVAEALGLQFGHLCLTAGASETWLFGRQTPNGFIEGDFSRIYREGGVFLADEMDAGDPNLLLAINTALDNGHLYNPISGQQMKRHESFIFIGAANTVGKGADGVYTGRNRLDGATLNRFVVILTDYCSEIEEQVCPDKALREALQNARKKLKEMRSPEIISTRTLRQAYRQKQAGIALSDIYGSVTAGWAPELVKQCGLVAEEEKKATAASASEDDLEAALEKERRLNAELKSKKSAKHDPFSF
jgi:cobaltochelatase CobS